MSRVRQIIADARYSLADPKGERWTDERLLRLLSQGQKDLARELKLLKAETSLALSPGQAMYKLPEDLWLITRAAFSLVRIPLLSYDAMDSADAAWFARTGNRVENLVYDLRNVDTIRVWPTPDDDIDKDVYVFEGEGVLVGTMDTAYGVYADAPIDKVNGVLASLDELASFNSVYGVTADLMRNTLAVRNTAPYFGVVTEFDGLVPEPVFGVLSDIVESDTIATFDSLFGVATDVADVTGAVTIQYIKDPDDVLSLDGELGVPRVFDKALVYYVIGHAFSDDLDTQYQQKSDRALSMYARELTNIGEQTREYDASATTKYNRSSYRGAFDD
ncbi:hypothetical protein [Edwardsiella phage IW-1]|uniref:Uncharacterized protein n=1 Tax=Edwardsiella phage IW-1 TaxID=1244857 RepID=K4PW93_9CAUD|nr:hypothetical protein [Edwardsiella phage IW-1]